jgi:hypothetical protein
MLDSFSQAARKESMARELSQSVVLLALTGSSVGGFLAMINVATKALGH